MVYIFFHRIWNLKQLLRHLWLPAMTCVISSFNMYHFWILETCLYLIFSPKVGFCSTYRFFWLRLIEISLHLPLYCSCIFYNALHAFYRNKLFPFPKILSQHFCSKWTKFWSTSSYFSYNLIVRNHQIPFFYIIFIDHWLISNFFSNCTIFSYFQSENVHFFKFPKFFVKW